MANGQVTDAEFDRLSWHDNVVYGMRMVLPEPDLDDWRCELIFDIDHIFEWLCDDPQNVRFRVAPVDLVFHNVSNLGIRLDFDDAMMSEISISEIHRAVVKPVSRIAPSACDWRFEVHPPPRGLISFRATGFTQTPRGAPLVLETQSLSRSQRLRFPAPAFA